MNIEEIKDLREKNKKIDKIISEYKMEIHDLVQEKNILIGRKESIQLKKSMSNSPAVSEKAEKMLKEFESKIKDLDLKIMDKAAHLEESKATVENSKSLVNEEIEEVKKNPAVLQHYNKKLIEKNEEKVKELTTKKDRITDFKTLVNTFPGLKMNFKTMVICGKEMRKTQKELAKVEEKISEVMKKMKEPNYKGSLLQDKRNLESEKSTLKKSLQEITIRYNEAKSLTIANMNTYSKYSKSFIGKELIFSAEEMEVMANSGKVHYERKDNGDLDFDVNSVLDSQIKGVTRDIKNHVMTNEVLKDEINGITNFLEEKKSQEKTPDDGNIIPPLPEKVKVKQPKPDFSFIDRGEARKVIIEERTPEELALATVPEKSRLSMFFKGIADWFASKFKKNQKIDKEPEPEEEQPKPIIKTTPVENIDLKDKDIEFLNELKVDLEYQKHNEEIMKNVARDNRKKEKIDKEK